MCVGALSVLTLVLNCSILYVQQSRRCGMYLDLSTDLDTWIY